MTTRRQRGALKAAKTRAINKSREEAAERKLRREDMDGNAAVLWDMMQTRRPLLRAQRAELDEIVIRLCQARVRQRNLYSKELRLMTAHGVYWKYVTWIRTSAVLSPVSPRQSREGCHVRQ